MLLRRLIAPIFALFTLQAPALAQEPLFLMRADPLHPAFGEDVTFTIAARSEAGLAKATATVARHGAAVGYDIAPDGQGGVDWEWIGHDFWRLTDIDQRPLKFTKDFRRLGSPFEDEFTFTIPAADWARGFSTSAMMLWFEVRVEDAAGRVETQKVAMAAGAWPAQSVIPIWWRGQVPDQIHMAFIADGGDYATARDMLPEIHDLIFGRVYESDKMREYNNRFSAWYASDPGFIDRTQDYAWNAFKDPPWMDAMLLTQVRIRIYVHNTPWRDRAYDRIFSTNKNYPGTYVHELGHGVFLLSDEYCGGGQTIPMWTPGPAGSQSVPMPHHNVYRTNASCRAYAINEGFDPGECTQICEDRRWWWLKPPLRPDRGIMRDSFDLFGLLQFERASPKRIDWFMNVYSRRP